MVSLRIILPLTSAAALMFACGPWSRASQPERAVRHTGLAGNSSVGTSLDVHVDDGVAMVLTVNNASKRSLELRFADGQTHDFVVLDAAGREVWRWSEGRMFTSMARTKLMKSGDGTTYAATWDPSTARGRYVALAALRSSNHPLTTRVEFTLP